MTKAIKDLYSDSNKINYDHSKDYIQNQCTTHSKIHPRLNLYKNQFLYAISMIL